MTDLDSSVSGKPSVKDEQKSGKAKRKERKLKNEPFSLTYDDVPETLNVMDFFEARAKEFSSMVNALKKKGGSKRTFQRLPRHMRRRATSHNVKRLPRRLRKQATNEMNSKSDHSKKETRRKKRRPSNLKMEYQSRQRDKKWLEMHLWHAKRMKMINRWGYRIALCCNDKGARANYRFIRNSTIISDVSYYSCIEIQGKENDLIEFLSPMFPSEATGEMPSLYTVGNIEGEAVLYKPHLYPYHCVGPVYFLWQPDLTERRKIWLWTHPSIHKEVLDIFETELTTISKTNDSTLPVVKVTNLDDDLVRFRLIGPKALSVLLSVLHLKKLPCHGSSTASEEKIGGEKYLRSSRKWKDISTTSQQRKWWREDAAIPSNNGDAMKYLEYLASNTDCLERNGSVFSLVVEDPRLFKHTNNNNNNNIVLPVIKKEKNFLQKMSNMVNESTEECNQELHKQEIIPSCRDLPPFNRLSLSPIWSPNIRSRLSSSKIPDCVVNEVRSHYFTKPDEITLGEEASAIPVLLINKYYSHQNKQRPNTIEVTGWDLVIPANWGLAFWIPLVHNGARACGLQELSLCTGIECLCPNFPCDYPDTRAGNTIINEQVEMENKYIRHPPDKRPNFGKQRIPAPFGSDWNRLLTEDVNTETRKRVDNELALSSEEECKGKKTRVDDGSVIDCGSNNESVVYVLRCLEDLKQLSNFVDTLFSKCWRSARTREKYDQLYSRYNMDDVVTRHGKSLVTVGLEVRSRGNLTSHSTISIPLEDDLVNIKSSDRTIGPVEPLCPRGLTVVEHNKIYIGEYQVPSKDFKDVQKQRKRLLKQDGTDQQIPSPQTVYNMKSVDPTRQTIGRINTTVNYRHSSSRYTAIGQCSFRGILELCQICYINNSKALLGLARGHDCQYVFTIIKVLK